MKRLFIFLLLITSASALLMSPATYGVKQHQGTDSYTIRVINDELQSINVMITPTGPLAGLITIQDSVSIAPGEEKSVPVKLQLPERTQPGTLESGIIFEARPVSAGMVSASSAVLHIIRIITPKNGTYIAAELLASAGIAGQPIALTISLTNTGTEFTNANATITIAGKEFNLGSVSLEPGETKNLIAYWTPDKIGVYTANAVITYGKDQLTLTTPVSIGDLSIDIVGLKSGDFRLGDTFKLSALAKSNWHDSIPATAHIDLQQNTILVSGTSTEITVQPLQETEIPVFLESRTLAIGPANATVTLRYADRTVKKTYPIILAVDGIIVTGEQTTGAGWEVLIVILILSLIFIIYRKYIKRIKTTR